MYIKKFKVLCVSYSEKIKKKLNNVDRDNKTRMKTSIDAQ